MRALYLGGLPVGLFKIYVAEDETDHLIDVLTGPPPGKIDFETEDSYTYVDSVYKEGDELNGE